MTDDVLKMSPAQMDALREIGNVGAGTQQQHFPRSSIGGLR